MSLLEELLSGPGPQDRLMQLQQLQAMTAGRGGAPTPGSPSSAPPGRGIFGNDQVDVLGANDPRLVSRFGVTLARPAMRSLTDILREVGFHGDAGGGYRTAGEQASLVASKPGLAAPVGSSYHQEGIALDLAAALQNARVERLLQQNGWNRFSPSGEPWHWSYGVTG